MEKNRNPNPAPAEGPPDVQTKATVPAVETDADDLVHRESKPELPTLREEISRLLSFREDHDNLARLYARRSTIAQILEQEEIDLSVELPGGLFGLTDQEARQILFRIGEDIDASIETVQGQFALAGFRYEQGHDFGTKGLRK